MSMCQLRWLLTAREISNILRKILRNLFFNKKDKILSPYDRRVLRPVVTALAGDAESIEVGVLLVKSKCGFVLSWRLRNHESTNTHRVNSCVTPWQVRQVHKLYLAQLQHQYQSTCYGAFDVAFYGLYLTAVTNRWCCPDQGGCPPDPRLTRPCLCD